MNLDQAMVVCHIFLACDTVFNTRHVDFTRVGFNCIFCCLLTNSKKPIMIRLAPKTGEAYPWLKMWNENISNRDYINLYPLLGCPKETNNQTFHLQKAALNFSIDYFLIHPSGATEVKTEVNTPKKCRSYFMQQRKWRVKSSWMNE